MQEQEGTQPPVVGKQSQEGTAPRLLVLRSGWQLAPRTQVKLNGVSTAAVIETGAFATLMADTLYSTLFPGELSKLAPCNVHGEDTRGKHLNIVGAVRSHVITPVGEFTTDVLVYQTRTPSTLGPKLQIGADILDLAILDFPGKEIKFSQEKIKQRGKPTKEPSPPLRIHIGTRITTNPPDQITANEVSWRAKRNLYFWHETQHIRTDLTFWRETQNLFRAHQAQQEQTEVLREAVGNVTRTYLNLLGERVEITARDELETVLKDVIEQVFSCGPVPSTLKP